MHLIGYGNPGRCDDGLGPAFAARIADRSLAGLKVSTDYQLTVDHALKIAEARQVVFVDALMGDPAPFRFARVEPSIASDLSSHSLAPESVLALARTLFSAEPPAYVLGISGREFGKIREGLSREAEENLRLAEAFFLGWHENQDSEVAAAACVDAEISLQEPYWG
jgi:hydrogenase maturation protease